MSAELDAARAQARASSEELRGWTARLEIGCEVVGDRTRIVRKRHHGPLSVQRAFYPEPGGVAHVYLLHPPGGIVQGDELHVEARVGEGAHALVTTPAATKFYRSVGRVAQQSQHIKVATRGTCEWLPQETIVFGGAAVRTRTRVDLDPGARFCGWDIVCLGRKASGDDFASGTIEQAFELWQGERPLWIERAHFGANEPARSAPWGLANHSVFGTLVCTGQSKVAVEAVRAARELAPENALFSVSQLREVIVCRYLGGGTENARAVFASAWAALRSIVLGRVACPPRIWLT